MLEKQIADVDKRISNILDAIERGMTNASTKQRLDDLESAKGELEIALAKEQIEKPPLTKEQIVFWIERFKGGDIDDPNYRRSIVDIFVNSVLLYDDRLVITFNYKDDSKTVSLSELESAESDSIDVPEIGGNALYRNSVTDETS
jgi:hypothetical protein